MRAPAQRLISVFIIVAVFAVDRATKWWAQYWLESRSPIAVVPFFHLTYVENTGAAFGVFHGSNQVLLWVSILLLAGLCVMSRRWPAQDRLAHCAMALVAGGALGNLYDRALYGYVVDFLDFRVWPVFNVADSSISVGAGLLVLVLWMSDRRHDERSERSSYSARP